VPYSASEVGGNKKERKEGEKKRRGIRAQKKAELRGNGKMGCRINL